MDEKSIPEFDFLNYFFADCKIAKFKFAKLQININANKYQCKNK